MLDIFLPRGIRNNNPGNIRLSETKWQGQRSSQSDADFVEFTQGVYGLRALMRLLLIYHVKYGLDTVQSLLYRYAPPHENATDRYIFDVAGRLKVKRTDVIDLRNKAVLTGLARAIVRHENGPPPPGRPEDWYDDALYNAAADAALDK